MDPADRERLDDLGERLRVSYTGLSGPYLACEPADLFRPWVLSDSAPPRPPRL
jgi:hypothetical protein